MRRMPAFAAMLERAHALGDTGSGFALIDRSSPRDRPEELLRVFEDWDLGKNLPAGHVRQSTFWLIDDDDVLCGEARVRHALTPSLKIEGGHVGYFVHPDHRGRGLGHAILRLCLVELARLGIRQAVVTCNEDNQRSRRVIEGAGGVRQGRAVSPRSGAMVLAFQVPMGSI